MKSQRFFRNLTAIAALGFAAFAASAQAQTNNVQAALEGELLVVTGDDLANAITITRNAVGDTLVVGRNGTKVNGGPSVRFPGAVLNSVEVMMFAGNDSVIVNNLVINNDLYLNLGDGNDTLRSGTLPTSVGANLTVEGGTGNEVIRLTGWSIGSDAYVDGQTGALNSQMTGLTVGFGITLIGDDARDIVSLTGCTSGDFTSIETKGENDAVTVADFDGLGLFVGTDAGVDTIALTSVATLDDITINSGTQNDAVDLTGVTSQKNITVSLDAGDDLLEGMNVFAQFDAVFEGGAGSDTYADGGISGGIKTDVKEFEIFP